MFANGRKKGEKRERKKEEEESRTEMGNLWSCDKSSKDSGYRCMKPDRLGTTQGCSWWDELFAWFSSIRSQV